MFLLVVSSTAVAQNAIVGTGFSSGWGGGGCPTGSGDFANLATSAGTSYITTITATSTGDKFWRFGVNWSGTTGQYTNTIGSNVIVTPSTSYSLNTTCTVSGALQYSSTSGFNYVFKTLNAGTSPTGSWVFFQVQGPVNTIGAPSQAPISTNVFPGQDVTVTATMSANQSGGQNPYLRYSIDNWLTSSVVAMTYTGTSVSAIIPGNANTASAIVRYYIFTSGPNNVASNGTNADLYTINLTATSTYTVQSGWTSNAGGGNWNVAGTWTANAVPSTTLSMGAVNIAGNVNMNQNASVSSITINNTQSLTATANTLIVSGGTSIITNNGSFSFSGSSLVNFASAGTITGTAIIINNLTINGGTLTLNTPPTINGNFQINNGNVSAAPNYGASSKLIYNVSYDRFNEWGTTGSTIPNIVEVNGGFTLGMSANAGNRSTRGDLNISGIVNWTNANNQGNTLSVGGDVNIAASGTIILSPIAAGTLTVAGSWLRSAGGTFTPGTAGTVIFMGTGKTITASGGASFYNLTINGTISAASAVTVANTLAIGSSNTFRLNGNAASAVTVTAGDGSSTINNGNATATATFTFNNSADYTFGGTLTNGSTGVLNVTKSGAGNLALSGGTYSYSGTTTISAGTLTATALTSLPDNSNISIGNATLALGASFSGAKTLGTLQLTGTTSNLNVGSAGAFDLTFANSSGVAWTGTFNVLNWTPTALKNIYFLNTLLIPGLTNTATTGQLDNFNFDNYGIGSKFDGSTGKVIPKFLYITKQSGPFNDVNTWQNLDNPKTLAGNESIYIRPVDALTQDVNNYPLLSINVGGTYNIDANTIIITASPSIGFVTNTGTINMVAASVISMGAGCSFNNSGTIETVAGSAINFHSAGGTLASSGPAIYTGLGIINFLGAGSITGTAMLPYVALSGAGGVNFGIGTTIKDSLIMRTNSTVVTNAPKYSTSSTLRYYQTTLPTFGRGSEWVTGTTSAAQQGYPNDVIIGDGVATTNLNLNNSVTYEMGGSLLITAGSSLILNDVGTPRNLKVIKNVDIYGTLKLGNFATGTPPYIGDLEVGGNFTRRAGGIFNANQRAVFFNGASNQTIDGTSATIDFAYLVINNSGTAGNNIVKFSNGTNATIKGGIGGYSFQMLNGQLDINGCTITFIPYTNVNHDIYVDGTDGNLIRNIFSSGPAFFNITNTNAEERVTTITRKTGNISLLNFSSNITVNILSDGVAGQSGVDFGFSTVGVSNTKINGTLQLNSKSFVRNNPPFYDPASTLVYQTGALYNRSAEWNTNSSTNAGFAGNVTIRNGTTLNFITNVDIGCAGNLSIGHTNSTVGTMDLGTISSDLYVGGDVIVGGNTSTSTLKLSGTIGGDLYIGKGWNRKANGVVNFGANDGRAVFFNGSADGTITASGGQQFPFVYINKTDKASRITLAANVSISDEISFMKGTIDLGSTFLTILSTSGKTARVGQSDSLNTAFVYGSSDNTGQFIFQRYMPARRAWRLMTAPLSSVGTHTTSQAWQELGPLNTGLSYTAANFANSILSDSITTGFGTHITGGTAANGFDQSPTNNSGIKFYNGTGSWVSPGNTNSTNIFSKEGWMLFVRGDRKSYGEITNQIKSATPTTLRPRGQIFIGRKTITSVAGGLTVVGNPYASSVDYNSMIRGGAGWSLTPTYYMWDPYLGGATGQGAFVTLIWNGTDFTRSTPSYGPGTVDNRYIPSGAAIVVNFPAGGTLTFNETNKATTNTTTAFRPVRNQLQTVLKTVDADGSIYLSDGTLLLIDPSFSNCVDKEDAVKIKNFTENFGLLRNDNILSIERKNLLADYDTVFYNLGQMRLKNYQFQFVADQIETRPGNALFLEDLYLKSKTALPLNDTSVYNFTVTTDTGSYAPNRFRLVFNPSVVYTNFSATALENMVAIDWKVAEEFNINRYEVERSLNAVNYSSINTQVSNGNSTMPVSYQILDKDLSPGIYYYRIKSISNIGVVKYSEVARVKLKKSTATTYIAPNPVTDNTIHLQMNKMPAGIYSMRLLNNNGQVIQASTINHPGANTQHTISLAQSMAKGSYQVELSAKGKKTILLPVLIQ